MSKVFCAEPRSVRYTDLGGIEAVLSDIKELVEYPLQHPEVLLLLRLEPWTYFGIEGIPWLNLAISLFNWQEKRWQLCWARFMHGWEWSHRVGFYCMGRPAVAKPHLPMPLLMNAASPSFGYLHQRLSPACRVSSCQPDTFLFMYSALPFLLCTAVTERPPLYQ